MYKYSPNSSTECGGRLRYPATQIIIIIEIEKRHFTNPGNMNNLSPEYLQDFLQFMRHHSEYYRSLWDGVPQGVCSLEDLPLTDLGSYWNAAKENKLLTGTLWNGSVFRTGGTTSEPKVVYVTREEIDQSLPYTGSAFANSGIIPGDRIANLFHIGGLYAGFAKMTMTLQHVHIPHVHLPITGNEAVPDMANFMKLFKATVIFGNVFTTCRVVDHLVEKGETIDSVRLILFAGESFYKDLRTSWLKAFPNMRARPLMYGAADGGLIGVPVHQPGAEDEDIKPTYPTKSATPRWCSRSSTTAAVLSGTLDERGGWC